MTRPRILFFGYSEVGYECLSLLCERGHDVVALFTHEDSLNEKIWFKTPAMAAKERGVPIYTPEKITTPEWLERIAALQPDLILSVYYRNMISTKILGLARLGAFNMHGSLLPKYRGRAPVNWAILHGEPRIGMTLHRMVKAADAGAVVDQEGVNIGPRDTGEEAFRKVLPCARRVLARQIDALLAGTAKETPQDETQATYFSGRTPEDGRIDWSQPSRAIFNLVRAVTDPYPGAFTDVGSARLMVWWAEPDSAAARAWVEREPAAPIHPGAGAGATPADGSEAEAGASGGHPPVPGTVLSLDPLVVATGDGALELTRTEWRGEGAPSLRVGERLGDSGPRVVGVQPDA
jgi:methionyl-tRNA formyltransferase